MADVVGKQEVLQAAHSLEDLLHQTTTHLAAYGNHTQDLHASGMLTGTAGHTNVIMGSEFVIQAKYRDGDLQKGDGLKGLAAHGTMKVMVRGAPFQVRPLQQNKRIHRYGARGGQDG